MPEASMTAADDTPQWRAQQTSPLAIASMVCGMVALVLGPLVILAIVFGHIARGQVRRTGEGGRGMATAGLILGYLVLVVGTALAVAFLASLPSQRQSKPSPLPDSAQHDQTDITRLCRDPEVIQDRHTTGPWPRIRLRRR
jgi:hypothetical protein